MADRPTQFMSRVEVPQVGDRPSESDIEAKRKAVRVGIADADAGRLIPFDEIKAWMRSWGSKNELPRPKAPVKSRS